MSTNVDRDATKVSSGIVSLTFLIPFPAYFNLWLHQDYTNVSLGIPLTYPSACRMMKLRFATESSNEHKSQRVRAVA